VAVVDEKVVGYLVFWWGCLTEPKPWGKRAPFSINLHKEYVDLEIVQSLMRRGVEVGRKLQADNIELMTLPSSQSEVICVLENFTQPNSVIDLQALG